MIQKLGIYQGDPQNSYSERVTIAEWQGASENRNCEDKSTQIKTNFRIMMCIYAIALQYVAKRFTEKPALS